MENSTFNKTFYKICKVILTISIPLLIVVLLLLQNPKLADQLRTHVVLATTVQPETFTELYFEDHTNLPSETILFYDNRFKFTIHNLEHKDMSYPYEVYFDWDGTHKTIATGTAFLSHDESTTIDVGFILNEPIARQKIVVELIGLNQQIHFWLNGETVHESQIVNQEVDNENQENTFYTNLYFDYSVPVPQTALVYQPFNFAFTIHNLENQDVVYPYEVYLEEKGHSIQIDSGEISLAHNELKTTELSTAITTPDVFSKVVVKLINQNKYIYFDVKGVNNVQ